MVIDDGGAIWLSNPWLVGFALTFAVSLVLWCHRWLETGKAPAPRTLRFGTVQMARRSGSTAEMASPSSLRTLERTRVSAVSTRQHASTRLPRTAA